MSRARRRGAVEGRAAGEPGARPRACRGRLLCVMLGHVKNWAFARLLASSLPDSEVAQRFLRRRTSRRQMREAYREHFGLHPLRREIVATGARQPRREPRGRGLPAIG